MAKCGNCTLCCLLLEITSCSSSVGEWCKECDPEVGCKIYKTRPKECHKFVCSYAQMDEVSAGLRPDQCGVIFERATESIFLGTTNRGGATKIVKNQVASLLREGFSVVINQLGAKAVVLPSEGRTRLDVIAEMEAHTNGCAKLHN